MQHLFLLKDIFLLLKYAIHKNTSLILEIMKSRYWEIWIFEIWITVHKILLSSSFFFLVM